MSKHPPAKPHPVVSPQPQIPRPPLNHRSRLTGPGVGLIIAGVLSGLSSMVFAIWALFIVVAARGVSEVTSRIDEIDSKQEMTEQDREMLNEMGNSISLFGHGVSAGLVVIGALVFVASCLIIYGGIQMNRGRSYGLCVFAAILAMLPSGCWLLSLPMGIWAIVVLLDNNVKAEFT